MLIDALLSKFDMSDQERASFLAADLSLIEPDTVIREFLDMGAGSGSMSATVLKIYPQSHGTLIDVVSRSRMKEFLPDLGEERYRILGWSELNMISSDRFNLVLVMDVLEHIPDWKSALKALFNHVDAGGYLYIQTPSDYPSPNWPALNIYWNRFLGCFGKNNPAKHLRHGLSCKEILDFCSGEFRPIVAGEDYVVRGRVFCDFKPRTHLLLRRI